MQLVSISLRLTRNRIFLCWQLLTLIGIDDDIQRRDSLHALVNNLPDAHYATLRALVLVCYPKTLFRFGRMCANPRGPLISISTKSKNTTCRTAWTPETLPSVLGKSGYKYPCWACGWSMLIAIYSPTLAGASSGGNIADAGWQVRVIETILVNTFQIFDDDWIISFNYCFRITKFPDSL